MTTGNWADSDSERALLRQAAVRRLVQLRARDELTAAHIATVASMMGRTAKTVRRWIEAAVDPASARGRTRFEINDALRVRLAYHRGNAAALHRELAEQARSSDRPAPSVHTVQRAVRRDLTRGERSGLKDGERARRRHDVYMRRPEVCRNAVWEGDHVEASNWVDVDGELRKPWITWFVDCGTNAVCGAAITPSYPSRESILVALRASISRGAGFGPFGGLPGMIRIDRGKDFLSKAVASSMAVFAVQVSDLPGYTPHLKGRVEAVNGAFKTQLCARLPRFTGEAKLANNKGADPHAPPLRFEAFVAEVLGWVQDWNTTNAMPTLGGRTPLQAWTEDPTPIEEVPEHDLALFTLEDDGRARMITTKGVSFHGTLYVGEGMVGRAGDRVRVRWMPNHPEVIEVFDAATGEYLGPAHPDDQASPEQVKQLIKARARKARQLRQDLAAAERERRVRYAAATTAAPPQVLGSVSALEAETELAEAGALDAGAQAMPDLFARRHPAPGWVMPRIRNGEAVDGEADG
ncbi:MAG TPA: Mu transposase C-terminal domain-containing protein [Actinocrinis sp.]|jgi:putative transposase|uniref:Mu transposase C-terminal domain-containing protein n=1 Tax=Actinocrinis sp. TaxID=1920516 RepID=UPI002DDD4D7D|nr:Mu transposase C-terminal domain-containing protein [Actinocrinis sp.]HEV3168956.1 Mu transposase C-terminal domain-containing protein [Actinocrinis sp.]